MALNIKNELADRMARELAELTGQTITDAVVGALRANLEAEHRRLRQPELEDIVERFGRLPVLDDRPSDVILGYDEHGLPSRKTGDVC